MNSATTLRFECPSCRTKLKAASEQAGKRGKCRNCGSEFIIPGRESPRGRPAPAEPSGWATTSDDPGVAESAGQQTRGRQSRKPAPKSGSPNSRRLWVAGIVALGLLTLVLWQSIGRRHAPGESPRGHPGPDGEHSSIAAAGPSAKTGGAPVGFAPRASTADEKEVAAVIPPSPKVVPAKPPGAGVKSPPRLKASVRWEFTPGSGGFSIKPHHWKTSVSLSPADGRAWTMVPDLVVGEAAGTDAISQGASKFGSVRPKLTLFGAPASSNVPWYEARSEVSLTLMIGETFFLGYHVKRDWQLNGKTAAWEPTRLAGTDRLDCVWEHATGSTFKYDVKDRGDYRPFHLGPLVFDADEPDGPCYVLAAFGKKAGRHYEWDCDTPELIPLDEESIRKEVMNLGRPDDWRRQFLVWYWDQPRPVKNAADILLDGVKGAEYPPDLKLSAAAALIMMRHKPALPAVTELLKDKNRNEQFRKHLVEAPGAREFIELSTLSAIAGDKNEQSPLREAALEALAEQGKDGWAVVERLKNDEQIGPKATKLLAERDKKGP